jgi:hypothetical protein
MGINMDVSGSVERLASLVGVSMRWRNWFDWPTIEDSVGRRLPDDYKHLVERFPHGEFQSFVQVNRPGDHHSSAAEFLGFYARILEDMRGYRAVGDGTYPYPIFPEPGGLLPWAHGRRREPLFWLTLADDPNAWPVVVSDYDFLQWRTFAGTASECLVDVVEGRFDGRLFGVDFAAHGPRFEPTVEDGLDSSAGSERSFWSSRGQAANEFAALAEVVGPAPGTAHPVVWPKIHDFMGVQLPSDYRSFIDTYGPGTFGDIKITVPGGPDGFDLYPLLVRAIEAGRAPMRSAPRRSARNPMG